MDLKEGLCLYGAPLSGHMTWANKTFDPGPRHRHSTRDINSIVVRFPPRYEVKNTIRPHICRKTERLETKTFFSEVNVVRWHTTSACSVTHTGCRLSPAHLLPDQSRCVGRYFQFLFSLFPVAHFLSSDRFSRCQMDTSGVNMNRTGLILAHWHVKNMTSP